MFSIQIPVSAMRRRSSGLIPLVRSKFVSAATPRYMQYYKSFGQNIFKRANSMVVRPRTSWWHWIKSKWDVARPRKKTMIGTAGIVAGGGVGWLGLPIPRVSGEEGFFNLMGTERDGIEYLKQDISKASPEKIDEYWKFALSDFGRLLKQTFGLEILLYLIEVAPDRVPTKVLNQAVSDNIDQFFLAQKSPELIKKLLTNYPDEDQKLFGAVFIYAQERSYIYKNEGGLDWWSSAKPEEIAEKLSSRTKTRNIIHVMNDIFATFSEKESKVVDYVVEYVKNENAFDMLLEFEEGIELLHDVFKWSTEKNKKDINEKFNDLVVRKSLSIINSNKIVPARVLLQSEVGIDFLLDLMGNDDVLNIVDLFFTSDYYTYQEPTHLKFIDNMLSNKKRMAEGRYKNLVTFLVKGIGQHIERLPSSAAPYLERILRHEVPKGGRIISLFREQSPVEYIVNSIPETIIVKTGQGEVEVRPLFDLVRAIRNQRFHQAIETKESQEELNEQLLEPVELDVAGMDPEIKRVFLRAPAHVQDLILSRLSPSEKKYPDPGVPPH